MSHWIIHQASAGEVLNACFYQQISIFHVIQTTKLFFRIYELLLILKAFFTHWGKLKE